MFKFTWLIVSALVLDSALAINPVILIPGYGGSQAYIYLPKWKREFHFWINPGDFLFTSLFNECFSLVFDPVCQKLVDNATITFPGWGETWSVEYLGTEVNYFKNIADHLRKKLGYTANKTMRGTPFDFRRSPNENVNFNPDLKTLIEETYQMNNQTRVLIIAHSMGNIYTHNFLSRMTIPWKQKYIRGYVAMSGPFGGSVKSTSAFVRGENFHVFFDNPLRFRPALRSFASTHLLMPSARLWNDSEPFVSVKLPDGQFKNYSTANLDELYVDSNFSIGSIIYKNAVDNLPDFFKAPTGVDELYCVYGLGIPTVSRMVFTKHNLNGTNQPDEVHFDSDGDGSVNSRSLQVCKRWAQTSVIELANAEHLEILKDQRMLNFLSDLLATPDQSP